MPDWEIIEWNESNYDVAKCEYAEEAYNCGKWAFVSDYARFDVLHEHGGIYMDVDVELLRSIPADILNDKAFVGMEQDGSISPGLILGAVPHLALLEELLQGYEADQFIVGGQMDTTTVNERVTAVLGSRGFKREDVFQRIDGLAIYPSGFFCGYDLDTLEPAIGPNTVSRHHYAGTWQGESYRRKRRMQAALKTAVGVPMYRRLLMLNRVIRSAVGRLQGRQS